MAHRRKRASEKSQATARDGTRWLAMPKRFWPDDLEQLKAMEGATEVDLIVPASGDVPASFHENPLVLTGAVRVPGHPRRPAPAADPPPPFGDEKLAAFLRGVARITAKAWVEAKLVGDPEERS